MIFPEAHYGKSPISSHLGITGCKSKGIFFGGGGYCADLSTSMKFDTDVDQNILNSFLRTLKLAIIGATICAKSKMAASVYIGRGQSAQHPLVGSE